MRINSCTGSHMTMLQTLRGSSTSCRNLMVRFDLIIRCLWVCSKGILLPSSFGVVPCNEAPNDQPLVPPSYGVLPSTEAPNNHPMVPHLSRALPTAETSPEQPL
ncbi:hypothetical protein ACFX2B_039697 [Malus domestica]